MTDGTDPAAVVAQQDHPKALIDLWVDELRFVFEQTERKYRRALDRGAPREAALRKLLSEFLPRKVGVTAGHVIANTPAWSQQCDVIVYDQLQAPVFSRDEGHQGAVIPVEGVYGIIEVKSVLTFQEFKKAAANIQAFKRLCGQVHVGAHRLSDRFGVIFAYRLPTGSKEERDATIQKIIEYARALPMAERPNDILVLGERAETGLGGSYLASLVPQGSPEGPLDYFVTTEGRINLKLLLLRLADERLRRVRTGMPDDHLRYLFEEGAEFSQRPQIDERRLRDIGAAPVQDAVRKALESRWLVNRPCPVCGSVQRWGVHADIYYLVTAKDFHFGHLGAPYMPIAVIDCENCGYMHLFNAKFLGVTP